MKKSHDVSPESPSDNASKPDGSRRRALRRLGAGGVAASAAAALPAAWTRPVVESVMLPAHAQTSGIPDGDFGLQLAITRWIDWLVPKAHAIVVCGNPVSGCATLRDGIVAISLNFVDSGNVGCYSGSAGIGGSFNLALVAGTEDEQVCNDVEGQNVSILKIEGEAPNRTIEIDMLGDKWTLTEGYGGNCQCGDLPA
jgi:hypothetical protein